MAKWRKSPPELVEAFAAALPDDPRVEPRKMFGYPCAFVNGNMFTGLHQEDMVVRLPEEERTTLLAEKGARAFEPMPGRRMREYVALPANISAPRRAEWVRRALEYAASLPEKKPRPRRKKKA